MKTIPPEKIRRSICKNCKKVIFYQNGWKHTSEQTQCTIHHEAELTAKPKTTLWAKLFHPTQYEPTTCQHCQAQVTYTNEGGGWNNLIDENDSLYCNFQATPKEEQDE